MNLDEKYQPTFEEMTEAEQNELIVTLANEEA